MLRRGKIGTKLEIPVFGFYDAFDLQRELLLGAKYLIFNSFYSLSLSFSYDRICRELGGSLFHKIVFQQIRQT